MNQTQEEQMAAVLAKAMAVICVRNTMLEDLHAGKVPVTRTGDFSDVYVVDAEGNRLPWAEVSRLDDDEIRNLMRQVVNRLYTFQLRLGEPGFQAFVDRSLASTRKWDEPKHDEGLYGGGQR